MQRSDGKVDPAALTSAAKKERDRAAAAAAVTYLVTRLQTLLDRGLLLFDPDECGD